MYTFLADMSSRTYGECDASQRVGPNHTQITLDANPGGAWRIDKDQLAAVLQGLTLRSSEFAWCNCKDTAITVAATALKGCIKGAKWVVVSWALLRICYLVRFDMCTIRAYVVE
jgi:hypothetical protein